MTPFALPFDILSTLSYVVVTYLVHGTLGVKLEIPQIDVQQGHIFTHALERPPIDRILSLDL